MGAFEDEIRAEAAERLRTLPCVNDNKTEIRREDAIAAITGLDSLAANSKDLDPTIQTVVQENFWELAGKQAAVELIEEAREFALELYRLEGKDDCVATAASRITDRDERIRRECADRAVAWYNSSFDEYEEHVTDDEWWDKGLRSAIMGEAKE
jgi:RNA processing factor Prp31